MSATEGSVSDPQAQGHDIPWLHAMLTLAIVTFFAYALWSPYAEGWPDTARTFAVAVSWVGLPSSLLVLTMQLAKVVRHRRATGTSDWPSLGPSGPRLMPVLRHWAWMVGYVVIIRQIGFLPATFAFILVYLMMEARRRASLALIYATATVAFMMVVFGTIFGLPWPRGTFNGLQEWILDYYWRLGG